MINIIHCKIIWLINNIFFIVNIIEGVIENMINDIKCLNNEYDELMELALT